jgi:hypothetical protein
LDFLKDLYEFGNLLIPEVVLTENRYLWLKSLSIDLSRLLKGLLLLTLGIEVFHLESNSECLGLPTLQVGKDEHVLPRLSRIEGEQAFCFATIVKDHATVLIQDVEV